METERRLRGCDRSTVGGAYYRRVLDGCSCAGTGRNFKFLSIGRLLIYSSVCMRSGGEGLWSFGRRLGRGERTGFGSGLLFMAVVEPRRAPSLLLFDIIVYDDTMFSGGQKVGVIGEM